MKHNESFVISNLVDSLEKEVNNPCLWKGRIPGLMIFSRVFSVFNIEKVLAVRWNLVQKGEGGLLGKMQALAMLSHWRAFFYCLWSRASYLGLDDGISRSYLVVHSNWVVILILLAQFNDFLRQVIHMPTPTSGEGPTWWLRRNLSPKAGLIMVAVSLGLTTCDSSGICFFGADAITSAIPSLLLIIFTFPFVGVILMLMNSSRDCANRPHRWWFRSTVHCQYHLSAGGVIQVRRAIWL